MTENNLPKHQRCPVCGDTCDLYEKTIGYSLHPPMPGISHVNVDALSYECENCNESWTTTETDDVTMERFNSNKKALIRSEKIKTLLTKTIE